MAVSAPREVKSSKTSGFNPCSGGGCGKPAVRPLVDTGAMVFVVFGILGVNRTQRSDNHVIGDLVRHGSANVFPAFIFYTYNTRKKRKNNIGYITVFVRT